MAGISRAEKKWVEATTFFLNNKAANFESVRTVDNYARRLELFRRSWIDAWQERADHKSIEDPSFTDVQRWRDELRAQGCKPSTINQYMKELSTFFRTVSDESLGDKRFYEINPVSHRLMPDMRKVNHRPYDLLLTDAQVMRLWRNNPIQSTHPENWPRNYAIVILLLTTKIRNAELLSLTPDDLDFESGTIYVEHGKGDKFRTVEFPEIAQLAVKVYLSSHLRPDTARSDEPLFGTCGDIHSAHDGSEAVWQRGTSQWLSSLVERHVRSVTGVEKIRTHDLRHIGARLDLNSGVTMEELQAELGHSSMVTTQRYSGKLMARAERQNAAKVYAERDRQAARIYAMLEAI